MNKHQFTREQVDFIRENLPGRSHLAFTALFNARFGLTLTCSQVTGAAKNRGINNGLDGRFKPGIIPFNTGRKGVRVSPETEFKKGNRPHNYKPVGSERINRDGYAEIKTADPKTWRMKHVLLWEAANGPVPKGRAVVFGDGDRQNLDLGNLVLVSRGELAVMNKMGLIGGSADLTKAGQSVASLRMKIYEREKGRKRR